MQKEDLLYWHHFIDRLSALIFEQAVPSELSVTAPGMIRVLSQHEYLVFHAYLEPIWKIRAETRNLHASSWHCWK